MKFSTCDLCDAHKSDDSGSFRIIPGGALRSYGGVLTFAGPVATAKCYEDNSLVKAAVESAGDGRVLVVDGAGSLRRALLGGNLAAAAAKNGWAGLVIDGAVRDLAELAAAAVGILARGHVPLPTDRRGQGLAGGAVQIAGVWVRPGDWLYADADGVVILATAA
jgi:regulator of ribonuclease activity A